VEDLVSPKTKLMHVWLLYLHLLLDILYDSKHPCLLVVHNMHNTDEKYNMDNIKYCTLVVLLHIYHRYNILVLIDGHVILCSFLYCWYFRESYEEEGYSYMKGIFSRRNRKPGR
jgi:hypothetical protein